MQYCLANPHLSSTCLQGTMHGATRAQRKNEVCPQDTRSTKHRGKGRDMIESEKMLWDRYNGIPSKTYTICCLFYLLFIIAFVHCSPGSLFIWFTAVASSDGEHASALYGELAQTRRTRPHSQTFWFTRSGVGLRSGISNKCQETLLLLTQIPHLGITVLIDLCSYIPSHSITTSNELLVVVFNTNLLMFFFYLKLVFSPLF